MYKVFFNEKLFHIKSKAESAEVKAHEFLIAEIQRFLKNDSEDIEYEIPNADEIFNHFQKEFHVLEAAGGVVFNTANELLFIERLGVPDLPKGKIEKGETPEIAALREVEEECGISDLRIVKQLSTTYHIYFQKKYIFKKTYWFEMLYTGTETPKPQTTENISSAKFVPVSSVNSLYEKTYRNLKDLFLYALQHK